MEASGGGSSGGAVVRDGEVEGGGGNGARGEEIPVVEEGDQRSSNTASATTTTIKWKPDEKSLEMLLAMGIDRSAALKGLYYTGNCSAEYAASYIFDNPDLDEELARAISCVGDTPKENPTPEPKECGDETEEHPHYTMAFITNASLNMGTGKIAAQVSDATLGLYRRLQSGGSKARDQLAIWEEEEEKKEFVEGTDETHLKELEKQALSMNCETFVCRDREAGVEEGAEAPHQVITLLAVFGRDENINALIEGLPLL